MALAATDCSSWKAHQLLFCVPLKALNQPRLPFVPKLVGSHFGSRQQSLCSNNGGVKNTGRFPSISSDLQFRHTMTRSISEFGLRTEASSRGEQADENHRPPFNLHAAVLLAGFAFESYNTPAENAGVSETNGDGCETTYLSKKFVQSIYDGQLFVNLGEGVHFPGLDLWGTSDPFVVLRIGDCIVRSTTIWVNKNPVWNETLTLNVKLSPGQNLQVSAWDANLVIPQRSMGETSVSLDSLCDGKTHSVELDLEGMGGGGRLLLEVRYKSFAQLEAEKYLVPFPKFHFWEPLENAFKFVLGGIGMSVREVVGDFMSSVKNVVHLFEPENAKIFAANKGRVSDPVLIEEAAPKTTVALKGTSNKPNVGSVLETSGVFGKDSDPLPAQKEVFERVIKHTKVIVEAGIVSNKSQGQSQEGGHVEPTAKASGIPMTTTTNSTDNEKPASRKVTDDVTEEILDGIKTTFLTTAENAMRAWAKLATMLETSGFVKSDFEKICFVENKDTDTQVALWRDLRRQKIVVAFRGTQKTKWRDVLTDFTLFASCLTREPVADGHNHEQEALVHSGFLQAYESVNSKILSLVEASMVSKSVKPDDDSQWHIYVTGHSLGGALATLSAFKLSSTEFAKTHNLSVTMYNFGSPRVGNNVFADKYNKIVKDSWRVLNHRDIIPTVPRLMGYCHIAQPIYLTHDKSPVSNLLDDGYNGDVVEEATPGAIIDDIGWGNAVVTSLSWSTQLKGEQALLQKLLKTEILMLDAVRDGSAFMQHMENFYYLTLSKVHVGKSIYLRAGTYRDAEASGSLPLWWQHLERCI